MPLPRVAPIIPTWRKQPFDDPAWLFDCKYDGFRAVCYVEQGCGRFVSRNGNDFRRFDALGAEVAAVLKVDEAILDGEVVPLLRRLFWGCQSETASRKAEPLTGSGPIWAMLAWSGSP